MTMSETRFAGQSFEQLQEQSQRTYQEVRNSISQTASAVTRYAQYVRPNVNPAELLVVVDSAIQTCIEDTLQRIEPSSGRIRTPNWQQQQNRRQQPQGSQLSSKQVRRALMALTNSGGGSNR